MKKATIHLLGLSLLLLPPALMAKGKPPGGGGDSQFSPVVIEVHLQGSAIVEATSPWKGEYPNETDVHHPWTSPDWDWATGGEFFFDNWDANDLAKVPRPCHFATVGALAPTGGRYDCFEGASETWPHGGRVSIDLAGTVWRPAKPPRKGWKDDRFCDLLNDPSAFSSDGYFRIGATRYQIFFMDGCDDKACEISVRVNSYSGAWTGVADPDLVQLHPFHDLPGYPNIGILSVSAWAPDGMTAGDLASPGPNELNVFSVHQEIPIDELTVDFDALGNGARQVTCTTNDAAGNPTLTGISLSTDPQ